MQPLIRLFKSNAKVLKIVRKTLYRFIIEKKTNKSRSLDAVVCNIVKDMPKEQVYVDAINKERGIEFTEIWNLPKKSLKDKILSQKMTLQ